MPLTINTVGSITNRQKSKTCSKRLSSLLQIRNMISALARWHRRGIKLSVLLAVVGLVVLPAIAGSIALKWDANPASDNVTGYKVYQQIGTNAFVVVGLVSTNYFYTNGIPWQAGVKYSWFVTATNSGGLESDPSATVSVVKPNAVTNFTIYLLGP